MTFKRIDHEHHPYLIPIQKWYEDAFPVTERRQFTALRQLLRQPDMYLCGIESDEQLVGFFIYWHWKEFLFIEHFAIDPDQRGNRLGQRALRHLQQLNSPCFILEVELPTDDLSRRRIQFYEREGFSVNPFPYAQPPYQRGNPPIPMHLMSSPAVLSQQDFTEYSRLIHERVYERFYV
ncbi:GNAT family N-acetyltransferase [Spirosoma linguale]|uniref:GCN5-related N-acetyltransferase n=1 Tax=Spirosoma linguale (strain ATCC 33905 / DSM 74 / LMG 10896 / Claus 1) TaxID=504472 RepID=D2QCR3_SPILD|nr:GCN5-related N-acetyltransferase [Spirosoma linguale DSM 74]